MDIFPIPYLINNIITKNPQNCKQNGLFILWKTINFTVNFSVYIFLKCEYLFPTQNSILKSRGERLFKNIKKRGYQPKIVNCL